MNESRKATFGKHYTEILQRVRIPLISSAIVVLAFFFRIPHACHVVAFVTISHIVNKRDTVKIASQLLMLTNSHNGGNIHYQITEVKYAFSVCVLFPSGKL